MVVRLPLPSRHIFWLTLVLCNVIVSGARATMPELSEEPKTKNLQVCQQWAAKQSDDAFDMWGRKTDGTSSKDFALSRLTSFCIGDDYPGLVGLGSSIGYDSIFCSTHLDIKICKDAEITYDEDSLEQNASAAAIRFVVTKNIIKELRDGELKQLFVADLYRLFVRNAREIDANWLTGTQELQGLRVDAVASSSIESGKFKVEVKYHINGVTQPDISVAYLVLRDGLQWRIYDIIFSNGISVRTQFH